MFIINLEVSKKVPRMYKEENKRLPQFRAPGGILLVTRAHLLFITMDPGLRCSVAHFEFMKLLWRGKDFATFDSVIHSHMKSNFTFVPLLCLFGSGKGKTEKQERFPEPGKVPRLLGVGGGCSPQALGSSAQF